MASSLKFMVCRNPSRSRNQNHPTTTTHHHPVAATNPPPSSRWPRTPHPSCTPPPPRNANNLQRANRHVSPDHIYLVCEPPGEPYYLARIMEFVHTKKDASQSIDMIRVNWYYRPKDINRKDPDTRVLFASMHSDTCPLSSIRGKCYIKHRSEIENLDEYRKRRDSFYFERMFDRYIQRYYDVIPSALVRNVPEAIRKALVERWRFLLVEPQRGKELCSQMKECKRCSVYCSR